MKFFSLLVIFTTLCSQTKGDIFLSGGRTPREGNVLINGRPICDDFWDLTDARIVCRQLGFDGAASATSRSAFGLPPRTDFAMDDVHCLGSERSIGECRHSRSHDCSSAEAAGVVCAGAFVEPTTPAPVFRILDTDEDTVVSTSLGGVAYGESTAEDPTGTGMGRCETKADERLWNRFMGDHYTEVFPDRNRNFGGAKWFAFCERKFCPTAERCDVERMHCCTHSYCPYSGAIAGGAARPYNQILLDFCVTGNYSVAICCSPCTCHLKPGNADKLVRHYKGMAVLFEHSCPECDSSNARMRSCQCPVAEQIRPVVTLLPCENGRNHSFGRQLDREHYKTCRSSSWDPMRGRNGK